MGRRTKKVNVIINMAYDEYLFIKDFEKAEDYDRAKRCRIRYNTLLDVLDQLEPKTDWVDWMVEKYYKEDYRK